jgi:beta-galactosidase
MGFFKPLDYWKWAGREDVVSTDSYPDPADPRATMDAAMAYDLIRSLGGGRPWVLMEQVTSQVNWRSHNVLKRPGQMRLWSYQAVAHGADGVMFFQWRASKAGAEKFHGALVPHVGTQNSRIWSEVTQLGRELAGLDVLLETRVTADVAIVFDWDSWWSLELDGKPSADLKMLAQVSRYYGSLHRQNIPVDFVQPSADLSGYRVVLVPNLYMVGEGVPENLERFVSNGGQLVLSFFSGIVDASDHILLGGYPAPFRRLLGMRVEEFDPYAPGQTNEIVTAEGTRVACDTWSDVIDLEGAATIATFAHDFYAGRPAITQHAYGAGHAYYLGTNPNESYLASLLAQICADAGVRAPIRVPEGVEAISRTSGSEGFLFLLNHQADASTVHLESEGQDILTGAYHADAITLSPYGVAILRRRRPRE